MYIQSIDPEEYKRSYPIYRTCKLRESTLARLREHVTEYKETIDQLVVKTLDENDHYRKCGYPEIEEKSW
jgi:hypothetical protein